MRFMLIVKSNPESEAGQMPSQRFLEEMGKFNEEMVRAGILLAGEGLMPSSEGARVKLSGSKRTVVDGRFSESKELVAGFWLIQVHSLEEAIERTKRCPDPDGDGAEIEVRRVSELEDFADALTPELRAQEERLRSELEQQTR
jgi:hypothetical protein